ncbi:MAG: flagellar hook-associated protein FlgL [Phycisphaerae bacterium]|nr:flagellar hook-associated protein FlgL [Phycisphaerae bacterium]
MAITSVSVSRISENLKALRLLDSLRQNSLQVFNVNNQLASGYQLLTASDDPIKGAKAVELNQLLEKQDQLLANLSHADQFLSATDTAIVDINSLLIDAHDIAMEHAGNLTDQEQREAGAIAIASIIDQLVMVGNRSHQGRYLFGGQRVEEAPFVYENGKVEFVGNDGDLNTHVDHTLEQAYNLTGDRLFGSLSTEVLSWKDWDARLTSDVRVADCDGTTGKGVALGTVEITETAVATFRVDLSEADSIGDVVDMINQAAATAGSSVTAAINAAGDGIQLTSGGPTIDVDDVGSSKTARDLGILTAGPVAMVAGSDINPRVIELTRLGDLDNVNLANLAAGFTITNGDQSQVVDTSVLAAGSTVQDLLNLIHQADVSVYAKLSDDGTGIDVVNRLSGSHMTIGENGGVTAEELGIRSMYNGTLLADLNLGKGVEGVPGETDFRVVARDGSSFEVDLHTVAGDMDQNGDGFETIEDVILAINNAAAGAGVPVTASLATTGNGIRLVDATGVNGTLSVELNNISSYAALDLGLVGLSASGAGATVEAVGQDVNPHTPSSVFTVLSNLHEALLSGDTQAITQAGDDLESVRVQINNVLGEVGSRAQAMAQRYDRTQEAVDATRKALSEVRDLDYAEAITRFQQAQMALQANLMSSSQVLSMSLLDFIR